MIKDCLYLLVVQNLEVHMESVICDHTVLPVLLYSISNLLHLLQFTQLAACILLHEFQMSFKATFLLSKK